MTTSVAVLPPVLSGRPPAAPSARPGDRRETIALTWRCRPPQWPTLPPFAGERGALGARGTAGD